MSKEEDKSEDIKELVIARLGIMPSNYQLSIGNKGTFTKNQLIDHVNQEDEIGKQIVKMQINFINALTSGKFMETLNKNE